jgi:hypothetical protein
MKKTTKPKPKAKAGRPARPGARGASIAIDRDVRDSIAEYCRATGRVQRDFATECLRLYLSRCQAEGGN